MPPQHKSYPATIYVDLDDVPGQDRAMKSRKCLHTSCNARAYFGNDYCIPCKETRAEMPPTSVVDVMVKQVTLDLQQRVKATAKAMKNFDLENIVLTIPVSVSKNWGTYKAEEVYSKRADWYPLDIGEFGKELVKVLRHPIKNSCSAEPAKLCHYVNAHLDETREVAGKTWCVVKVENDGTVHWGSSSGGKSEVVCPPLPPRDTTGPYASENPQLQKFKGDLAKAYGMSDQKWDEIPKK